jgi:hypothetical protein
MQPGAVIVCTPLADTVTLQFFERAAASVLEIGAPLAVVSCTLIGTVWPRFHFEFFVGDRKPPSVP